MEGPLTGEDRFVIVLDGLDECGNQERLDTLMDLVFMLHDLPTTFAVLVSCRPETQVVSAFTAARDVGYVIPSEDMDLIEKSETYLTIRRMIEESLQDRIKRSKWEPSKADLTPSLQLVVNYLLSPRSGFGNCAFRLSVVVLCNRSSNITVISPMRLLTSTQSTCAYCDEPIWLIRLEFIRT
jgi:hypothetical protein